MYRPKVPSWASSLPSGAQRQVVRLHKAALTQDNTQFLSRSSSTRTRYNWPEKTRPYASVAFPEESGTMFDHDLMATAQFGMPNVASRRECMSQMRAIKAQVTWPAVTITIAL